MVKFSNINSTLTSPRTIIETPTRAYVDALIENDWIRRDNSTVIKDQDNDIKNNKWTNLSSVTVKGNPLMNERVSNKKKRWWIRFWKTFEKCLDISVGNTVNNHENYNKQHFIDTTTFKYPNTRRYLLQQGNIQSNNITNSRKIQICLKSTKTVSPTRNSGAIFFCSFMYIGTSQIISGFANAFLSERTDIIQIIKVSISYSR